MKKPIASTSDPNVLAVLHKAGKGWRALIAGTRTAKPSVIATRDFSSEGGQASIVEAWFDEHEVGSVLCVLPSASVICRNCPLPAASSDQLEQALRLQAEAHLLGIAPPHRLAMSVLPSAPGETSRTGIILAWPERAAFDPPPTSRPVRYVPDVAALAAILNGNRPAESLLWLDRADGSVALAIAHAGGAIFRCTREDSASSSASLDIWPQSIGRIVAETAMSVGHTGPFIESLAREAQSRASSVGVSEAALFLPPEQRLALANRAIGLSEDSEWWSHYGIAVGGLLAYTGPLKALTLFQHTPPIEAPSRIKTAVERLSRPRTAATVAIACVITLLFGPLVVSALRYQILQWRFGDVQEQLASAITIKNQKAMYEELQKQQTWPMTKLLADITTNTPLGIELELIRIESGKDFAVSGTAIKYDKDTPQEVFAIMQENLRERGLFTDLVPKLDSANNLGMYKFDLSGKVNKPYKDIEYPESLDFGKLPYSVRLYGDRAKTTPPAAAIVAAPPVEDPEMPASRPDEPPALDPNIEVLAGGPIVEPDGTEDLDERRAAGRRSGGASDDGAIGIDERPETGGVNPDYVPPALTQEQIDAMQLAEVDQAMSAVAKARGYHKKGEVHDRLKREFDMLIAQKKKLRRAGQ